METHTASGCEPNRPASTDGVCPTPPAVATPDPFVHLAELRAVAGEVLERHGRRRTRHVRGRNSDGVQFHASVYVGARRTGVRRG